MSCMWDACLGSRSQAATPVVPCGRVAPRSASYCIGSVGLLLLATNRLLPAPSPPPKKTTLRLCRRCLVYVVDLSGGCAGALVPQWPWEQLQILMVGGFGGRGGRVGLGLGVAAHIDRVAH